MIWHPLPARGPHFAFAKILASQRAANIIERTAYRHTERRAQPAKL